MKGDSSEEDSDECSCANGRCVRSYLGTMCECNTGFRMDHSRTRCIGLYSLVVQKYFFFFIVSMYTHKLIYFKSCINFVFSTFEKYFRSCFFFLFQTLMSVQNRGIVSVYVRMLAAWTLLAHTSASAKKALWLHAGQTYVSVAELCNTVFIPI